MFTVKLYRGHTSRYVQADSVEVFAAGPAAGIAEEPKDRTNDVREISIVVEGSNNNRVFYVAKGPCWVHEASAVDVYDVAYIENECGATTERVAPS